MNHNSKLGYKQKRLTNWYTFRVVSTAILCEANGLPSLFMILLAIVFFRKPHDLMHNTIIYIISFLNPHQLNLSLEYKN